MRRYLLATTPLVVCCCCLSLWVDQARAKIVLFRNDAGIRIRFSLRAATATAPVTKELEVGGRIQFDLSENLRFDFCGVGLDDLNGTFGATNIDVPQLLANVEGNEVGVDGTLERLPVCECGRWISRLRRTAILLIFPQSGGRDDVVITARPVCADYVNWFYYGSNPREQSPSEVPRATVAPQETLTKINPGGMRTWTNSIGNQAEAKLVRVSNQFAYFERANGKSARSLVSNLSIIDQQWIGDWSVSTAEASPREVEELPEPFGPEQDKQASQ